MTAENWGFYIKRIRELRRMTKTELSKSSGLLQSHITRIENGEYKYPRHSTVNALAKGLEIQPAEIYKAVSGIRDIKSSDSGQGTEELLNLVRKLENKIRERGIDYP